MDAKKIIDDIKKSYTNLGTISVKITEYLSYLKNLGVLNENQIDAQRIFREELLKLKKEIDAIPNEPFDKSIQLEKLRKMWKKSDASNNYKLLTGLYIWIPSLRSDYVKGNCEVIGENIFIKNLVKVNKDQNRTIKIPKEIKPYISEFNNFPKDNKIFCIELKKASLVVFKKGLTVNSYRHIWTEYGARKYTKEEIEKLSYDMNHSVAVHKKNYMPKTEEKMVYKK
jgi:hypothetical protein